MGHATYQRSIHACLPDIPDVEARFRGLPEMPDSSLRLATGWPLLRGFDLDLQTSRWHAVQGVRARRVLRDELAVAPIDVVHVKSHSIAMGLIREMPRVPIVPVVDVTVWAWREMAIWRRVRSHSRAMIWPSEAAERSVFARAPMVIALTNWARQGVLRVSPGANVVRHHPGIDIETFSPAPREARDAYRILFVGGRFEAKGGYDLLDALAPRLGRDVELDIVTADEIPETPGVRVHRLSSGDERLVRLYQQADLFCLPTYGDSNPWVILEAMACGTPVISTTVGAIPELLGNGGAGVAVPPGARSALRVVIDQLLSDDAKRLALGALSREHCEREFDAQRQVPLLFELLREAAELGPSALPEASRSHEPSPIA
ncbi:MAG TPA: glycosyltransferase family 4 protein [Solirubrobacteraceae bacterium]|jgi:glycosyltransferase involved in cell wall biosynthesis